MQSLAIIALCLASTISYGIVHDLISARICVEYFTIGHPPIFDSEDPVLLGIGWGVVATWWVGLILGVALAAVSRVGPWPKRSARSLLKPISRLMVIAAIFAFVSGTCGSLLARNGVVFLLNDLADRVPKEQHNAYLACLWAHSASYLVGFFGGLIVIVRVGIGRFRQSALERFSLRPDPLR